MRYAKAGWHRIGGGALVLSALLLVSALCLIKPGLITDTVGLVLLGVVSAAQLLARRRQATEKGTAASRALP